MKPSKNKLSPRPRVIGPGTVVALLIGAFYCFQVASKAPANTSGTSAPSLRAAKQLPPLWKPEPGTLLLTARLSLDASQTRSLEAIDRQWRADKKAFRHRMESLEAQIDFAHNYPSTNSALSEYEQLSRSYDLRRSELWIQAEAVLKPAQIQSLEDFAKGRRGA